MQVPVIKTLDTLLVVNLVQSSTVQRVQYSNDTTTASPKGTLTYVLSQGRATGNANFAYVGGGGGVPAQLSTSNRIDYSNDTATAVTKGPLSTGRYSGAATGNTSVGYFGGGVYVSSIDCVDYSNDTATAVHKSLILLQPISSIRI